MEKRTSKKMRKNTGETILKFLIEVYNRSQSPILTRDLFRGNKKVSLYGDMKLGKMYTLDTHFNTGTLVLVEEESAGKKTVKWNPEAGYPTEDLAYQFWYNANVVEREAKEAAKETAVAEETPPTPEEVPVAEAEETKPEYEILGNITKRTSCE